MAGTGLSAKPMKHPTAVGKTGGKRQFTLAEYSALSREEQSAIQKGATFLLEYEIRTPVAPVNDQTLLRLFEVYRPRPKPPSGSSEIRHRFQSFYLSAAELAETKLQHDGVLDDSRPVFNLVIDVDYDRAYIVDYDRDKRSFCYLKTYGKSWSFGFETLEALAGEVLDARERMVERFLKLTDQASQRGIQ